MVTKKALYVIGVAAIAAAFLPGYVKMINLHARNREFRSRIEQLKRQNAIYLDEIRRLKTDPAYVEKVAREKMGVVREGEISYKVVTKQPDEAK